jgi:hypothetical protein
MKDDQSIDTLVKAPTFDSKTNGDCADSAVLYLTN